MSGHRIRHATERNCMFTLVDGKRMYDVSQVCVVCGREHQHKTYHISVDDAGTAIVSEEVWARLQAIPGNPFTSVNTVAAPPSQGIAMAHRQVAFATSDMEEVPAGVIVRHPNLINQRLVAVDRETPYAKPYLCGECVQTHTHKTYHIDLDADGSALVSPQIAAVLERLGMEKNKTPEPVRLVHGDTNNG